MNKSQLKSKVPTISKGYTIGQLTVKERLSEKKNGYSYWRCECDCGGEILLDTRCLQRGTVTDCGWSQRQNAAVKVRLFGVADAIAAMNVSQHPSNFWRVTKEVAVA